MCRIDSAVVRLAALVGTRRAGGSKTPNKALQRTGHATGGSARHTVFLRVSRPLSLVFGEVADWPAVRCIVWGMMVPLPAHPGSGPGQLDLRSYPALRYV